MIEEHSECHFTPLTLFWMPRRRLCVRVRVRLMLEDTTTASREDAQDLSAERARRGQVPLAYRRFGDEAAK